MCYDGIHDINFKFWSNGLMFDCDFKINEMHATECTGRLGIPHSNRIERK